jgi:hypothetical protein
MKRSLAVLAIPVLPFVAGCATTQYKPYEAEDNVFEGKGGTKVVVDGMEIWDNGDPPRKFRILGIIDDQRPGGIIPMSALHSDMVKKAREAGISTSRPMNVRAHYPVVSVLAIIWPECGSRYSWPRRLSKTCGD